MLSLPNEYSIHLHESLGFRRAGVFREIGFKNSQWYDVGIWQRELTEAQTPPVWFLSPGIPTPAEMAQIKDQMRHADVIVIYREYDPKQEAWGWPELAQERKPFELRTIWGFKEHPLFVSKHFLILQRHDAPAAAPSIRDPSTAVPPMP